MKNISFIVNPISGSKSKRRFLDSLGGISWLSAFDYRIHITKCRGNATEIVSHDDSEIFMAVGGDGTVNEVVSGITDGRTVGIVPFGSGNGLARHLGISMNKMQALSLLKHPYIARIDYGTINGKVFCCTCGIGLDACVDARYSEMGSRGFISYVKSTVLEWRSHVPFEYSMIIDGKTVQGKASMITVGNANQWGNNAYITPDASVCDGLLDVCVMDPIALKNVPSLVFLLFAKCLPKSKLVHYYLGKRINIHRKTSGPAHFDGEPIYLGKDINISVCENSLNVMVPQGRKI